MRISCIEPPEKERTRWAREVLIDAVEQGFTPATVSSDKLVSFSVTLQAHQAKILEEQAFTLKRPIAEIAAGLIENARAIMTAHPSHAVTTHEGLVGGSLVHSALRPLAESTWHAVRRKKIVFAEASGAGNGMMLASLAATAVAKGQKVVVRAPLSVTWQLIENLAAIPEALSSGLALILARTNVVSPLLIRQWATDRNNQELLNWIDVVSASCSASSGNN
jgi:hypothetical protein